MHTAHSEFHESFMRKGKGNQSGVPKRVYGHQGMAHPLTNRRNHWIGVWPFGTGPDQQKATGELHEKRKGNQSGVPKRVYGHHGMHGWDSGGGRRTHLIDADKNKMRFDRKNSLTCRNCNSLVSC